MPRSRYRKPQNMGGALFVLIFLALWYMGKIPGLPSLSSVLGQPSSPSGSTATAAATGSTAASPGAQPLGARTKTSGCVSANALPDAQCTPGAIFPDATVEQICTAGYSSKVRNVSQSTKDDVYAEYGIASHQPGEYEVDHLVSLELGGSNDIANLWPEPADPRPGFHEKDQVENYLHDQVCSGSMTLQQAQSIIAHDWLSVYQGMPK